MASTSTPTTATISTATTSVAHPQVVTQTVSATNATRRAATTFVEAHCKGMAQSADTRPVPASIAQQPTEGVAGTSSATTNAQSTPNTMGHNEMQKQLVELQKKFDMLEKSAGNASVEEALQRVMEVANTASWNSRPQLLNALRILVDRATNMAHPKLSRYRAVLAQFETNDFGDRAGHLIFLLLGNKEEEEIAAKVTKFLDRKPNFSRYNPYFNRRTKRNGEFKCYACQKVGHFAKNCPDKK
ncbi:uncharacterized protein [Ptychodera flava]|uniref:uncharacterized protein n=1 Tax=Ptychodera flava TaxID=63121 RepID=UPI003969FB4C